MTVYDLAAGMSVTNEHGLQCDWYPNWTPDGTRIALAYRIAGHRVVKVDDVRPWFRQE